MSFIKRSFILMLIALVSLSTLIAKEVVLYENAKQVPDYEARLKSIAPGDELIFSDNQRLTIVKKLGQGGSSQIFETSTGKAVRLTNYYRTGSYFNGYLSAALKLQKSDFLLLPELFDRQSNIKEYLLVEKVDVLFTMEDFLKGNYQSDLSKTQLESKIFDFAETTAQLDTIRDFKPANIVWDGDQWRLLDFDDGPIFASGPNDSTVFDYAPKQGKYMRELPEDMIARINERIKEVRASAGFTFIQNTREALESKKEALKETSRLKKKAKELPTSVLVDDDIDSFLKHAKKMSVPQRMEMYKNWSERLLHHAYKDPSILKHIQIYNAINMNHLGNPYVLVHDALSQQNKNLQDIIYYMKAYGLKNSSKIFEDELLGPIRQYESLHGKVRQPLTKRSCRTLLRGLFL
ncbi:MAG: hypothetical protein ACJAT2_001216 [Bacteriovoracaceae bacterium]|jgi:hypothetical protein